MLPFATIFTHDITLGAAPSRTWTWFHEARFRLNSAIDVKIIINAPVEAAEYLLQRASTSLHQLSSAST